MIKTLMLAFVILMTGLALGAEDSLPSDDFQGVWEVRSAFRLPLRESGEKIDIASKYESSYEIRFRVHESGALQQYWKDKDGLVIRSRGIKVFNNSSTMFE